MTALSIGSLARLFTASDEKTSSSIETPSEYGASRNVKRGHDAVEADLPFLVGRSAAISTRSASREGQPDRPLFDCLA